MSCASARSTNRSSQPSALSTRPQFSDVTSSPATSLRLVDSSSAPRTTLARTTALWQDWPIAFCPSIHPLLSNKAQLKFLHLWHSGLDPLLLGQAPELEPRHFTMDDNIEIKREDQTSHALVPDKDRKSRIQHGGKRPIDPFAALSRVAALNAVRALIRR